MSKALFEKVERLQDILVAYSTGGHPEDGEYVELRRELLAEQSIKDHLPEFIRRFRHLRELWPFIQGKFSTYRERRQYLWGEFAPLLDMLERSKESPASSSVSEALKALDPDAVHKHWERALARLLDEPDGAITLSRTLLESVCKHILDDAGISYEHDADLPKLCSLTMESLQLAPGQQTEKLFRQILGACVAIVQGVGAMRNKLGDAHGAGKLQPMPYARHAELAVNLAGGVAIFLVATWEANKRDKESAPSDRVPF